MVASIIAVDVWTLAVLVVVKVLEMLIEFVVVAMASVLFASCLVRGVTGAVDGTCIVTDSIGSRRLKGSDGIKVCSSVVCNVVDVVKLSESLVLNSVIKVEEGKVV